MVEPDLSEAYPPPHIAWKVERLGVSKAHCDALTLLVLAVLAGAFMSLGALFYTVVVTQTGLGFGVTRLLGGVNFCLGLILVVIAGAELFMRNNLIAMAWAIGLEHSIANWFFLPLGLALDGQNAVPLLGFARNILAVTAGNIVGGTLLVAGVYWVAYLRSERISKDQPS